ncbi:MAG TPA: histidine kinase [Candidatus Sulfotelmatobacter sp.]|jgi:two-component system, LytTR family, sensor kinase|nr:histidine kinase [Candidatus Sulfotelmatobacter sp.]
MESRLILIHLLLKLGVAAAVSSSLVRSLEFKSLLFREERTLRQKINLVLWFGLPIMLGVWIRIAQKSFLAGDLSFETVLLLSVIGGRWTGVLGGVLMGFPSLLYGEWLALPFLVLCGLIAGQLRTMARDKDDIWTFSPFIDLSIYRLIRRNLPRPRLFDWQIMFLTTVVGLRFVHTELSGHFPRSIFALESPGNVWLEVGIYAASVVAIGIELKIFNSVRIQIKLEEQERLLLRARMEALQNQVNPHFLFNTLNSISSLVRFDPDMAREVIFKLATILRRLLNTSEAFAPLRDEFEFIDNYLDIEVVRFGRDKLRVVKELDPASLDVVVPSMLLQPLVENSIKHGLSPKVEGGSIYLRSRVSGSRLVIEVEDDGVGMGAAQLEESSSWSGMGIGMANISERLQVLYGDTARMTIDSHEGKGTLIRIRLPLVEAASSVPEGFYAERSSTRR